MTQMDIFIGGKLLPVILLWAITYSLDYYLTILGARLYRDGAKKYVTFEGSYELTPTFKEDVDALQLISPKFLGFLGVSIALIFLVWLLDVEFRGGYLFFSALVGALFLREVAIFVRHIRNIATFVILRSADSVRGKIEYRRWVTLRVSSIELFSFASLYFLLYLLDLSWFFLGGAIACMVTGVQHFTMSMGERAEKSTEEGADGS